MSRGATYRFGPLQSRGLIAGFRAGQVVCVACTLVVAIGMLRVLPGALGLAGACAVVIGGLVAVSWPFGGRTCEQWAPVVLRWVTGSTEDTDEHVGENSRSSSAAQRRSRVRVHRARRESATDTGAPRLGPPRELEGCTITAVRLPGGSGKMGAIFDPRTGFATGVLSVSSDGFALLDNDERARSVASWASLLSGLARDGSAVKRIQWIKRSVPDRSEKIRSSFFSGSTVEPDSLCATSYAEIACDPELIGMRHDSFVALSVGVPPRPLRGGARAQRMDGGHFDALAHETAALAAELDSCGLNVEGALDPYCVTQLIAETFGVESRSGTRSAHAWPTGTKEHWDHFTADSTHHALYWIAEWPRIDVGSDFLAPLLLLGSERLVASVVMEPVSTVTAVRRVESARVARAADDELRRRGGFSFTARRRREDESLANREVELADGHAHYRFSGYLCISAGNVGELERSCGVVEQAASRSYLALRRLYGEQAMAFTRCLPLGRGVG